MTQESDIKVARRIAGARLGGRNSASARVVWAERLDQFRDAVNARLGTPNAIQVALLDTACALYLPLMRRSKANLGANARVNILALSAGATSLRAVLRDLGLLGTAESDLNSTKDFADIIGDDDEVVVSAK